MSVEVDEHLPSRDSALSLDPSVTDSSSAIVPESSSFSASSVQSDMHPVVGNTLDETSSSPPLSDRRHVPALQLESLDVNHDSSPHPSFSSPKPVSVVCLFLFFSLFVWLYVLALLYLVSPLLDIFIFIFYAGSSRRKGEGFYGL